MIHVGITERHGIADEYAGLAPPGVSYSFVQATNNLRKIGLSSSAKGIFNYYKNVDVDILEAPIFPIATRQPWIYTPAEYSGSANFGFFGLPIPRVLRLGMLDWYFSQPNLKKILFKSYAGIETLKSYGRCSNEIILSKAEVVYPAIKARKIHPPLDEKRFNLLFSGDFFRKGGANVVEAFEALQPTYPNLRLTLCCDPDLLSTGHPWAKVYHRRIQKNLSIHIGRVPRHVMLKDVLPNAGIFLSPTLRETFGFAILEAMAFGLPVIASDVFAIPEIISHNVDGFMVSMQGRDFVKRIKGYDVGIIPTADFDEINEAIVRCLEGLLTDSLLFDRVGYGALEKIRSKFSPEIRAQKMLPIYEASIEPNAIDARDRN
ncbi:MAG: glycosyltransferase family 4 protein [Pseudomonadales bacterium]|nr:glycosyltransferase family 4 protein [Pseudomonadales bacterium]